MDGSLYIPTGDGGSACNPGETAQDLDLPLGKILRIDVDGGFPYAIPPDNPFAGEDGLDEIWALGLRNPWRASFDRATGDFAHGDVGQYTWEEINVQPASSAGGENDGWDCAEEYECPTFGCHDGGEVTDHMDHTEELQPADGSIFRISSFGEDARGELYIVEYAEVAELYRIAPAAYPLPFADVNCDLAVDVRDLLEVILSWGTCVGCAADVDGDVDVLDLIGVVVARGDVR